MKLVVAAVLVMLTAACGVRPTGVIAAGTPAVAQQAVPQTTVYMARSGGLVPVRRPTFPGAPQAALYVIAQGDVTGQEAAQGMWDPINNVKLRVTYVGGVLHAWYDNTSPDPGLALAQLVCTAAAQPGVQRVDVTRDGRSMGKNLRCSRFKRYISP